MKLEYHLSTIHISFTRLSKKTYVEGYFSNMHFNLSVIQQGYLHMIFSCSVKAVVSYAFRFFFDFPFPGPPPSVGFGA